MEKKYSGWKSTLKNHLEELSLLEATRKIAYWFTQFDPNTTNPRRRTIKFYSQFISRGDLCFDIGANIGQRTSVFLELGAEVICLEPQSSCFQTLNKLFENNHFVSIENLAVASRAGYAEIQICDTLSSISSMSKKWTEQSIHAREYGYKWTKTETIFTTTLDLLIAKYGVPKFCKIDVEGFEEEVMKGLNYPIPYISFEFNTGFIKEAEKCVEQLLQIGNYSFNFAVGEPSGGEGLVLDKWSSSTELFRCIDGLSSLDKLLWGDIYAKY
jgi:FkbM family methyltransferase